MDALSDPGGRETSGRSDGYISGLAVGTVTTNADEANLGRVRVRLPWHAENKETYWAKTAVPMAGEDRGMFMVPEPGDEVLLGFENGDPSHPYVIGSLWSESRRPPVSELGLEERVIKTRSGHVLRFSDAADQPEIELSLADGKSVVLNEENIELSVGESRISITEGSITIAATEIKLEGDVSGLDEQGRSS